MVIVISVIGADVAKQLSLKTGDSLISTPETVFDIAGIYPLKMNIVGVLKQSHTPDDRAVFVDLKTAWIIEMKSGVSFVKYNVFMIKSNTLPLAPIINGVRSARDRSCSSLSSSSISSERGRTAIKVIQITNIIVLILLNRTYFQAR